MANPLERLRYHVTGAIERGEKEAIVARELPESVNTPLHTIEILRGEMERHFTEGKGGARFVNVDTRVLAWLCDDAEMLNKLVAAKIEAA